MRQDPDHPGAQRRASLEAVRLCERRDDRVLREIAGQLLVARGAEREATEHGLERAQVVLSDRFHAHPP